VVTDSTGEVTTDTADAAPVATGELTLKEIKLISTLEFLEVVDKEAAESDTERKEEHV